MVVVATAISNKKGQVFLSRQFVDMTKSRLESLVNIFPRLMSKITNNSQHTFIETSDVRYLYHPMENFYLIMLTTKSSNIIDDIETLKIFVKISQEYCRTLTESDLHNAAFDLLFAFDEVISLGYKEDVTTSQIRTITDMDSHDERIYLAMRQSQERDAKERMKEKARELEMQRRLQASTGNKMHTPMSYTFSNSVPLNPVEEPTVLLSSRNSTISNSRLSPTPVVETNRTLKLGSSRKNLKTSKRIAKENLMPQVDIRKSQIQFRSEEKISIEVSFDQGCLKEMDINGLLYIHCNDKNICRVQAKIDHQDTRPIQIQTHPHLDRDLFQNENVLGMKQIDRAFPFNNDVYLMKWVLKSTSDKDLPLKISCWPNKTSGGLEMTIEYELIQSDVNIIDLWISAPIGSNDSEYEIMQYEEGEYSISNKCPSGQIGRFLVWRIPAVSKDCAQRGMIEYFVKHMSSKESFPVNAGFNSKDSLCGMKVVEVTNLDDVSLAPDYTFAAEVTCNKYRID